MEFKYGIDDRPRLGQLLVYSLQWFVLAVAVIVTSIFIAQGSKRNMLLAAEDFAYIFNVTDDVDQKVMTALMMIEKEETLW